MENTNRKEKINKLKDDVCPIIKRRLEKGVWEHDCKYCEYKCRCNRGGVYIEDCDGCGCNYMEWR